MSVPETRPSLIARIRDPANGQAWAEFSRIYAPVIYRFARGAGLQDADAQDLTQEVLRAVASSLKRWEADPEKGKFRSWLYGITRNKLLEFWARQRRSARATGDSTVSRTLAAQATAEENAQMWEAEYQHHLFNLAAEQVRRELSETTWQAFWLSAVEGKSAKAVAETLGLSAGSVYVYTGRVMRRLKERVQQLMTE